MRKNSLSKVLKKTQTKDKRNRYKNTRINGFVWLLILIPSILLVFLLNNSTIVDKFCTTTLFCKSKAANTEQIQNMMGLSIDPNNLSTMQVNSKSNNKTRQKVAISSVGGTPTIQELNDLNVKWVRIEHIDNPNFNYEPLFDNLHANNKKVLLIVDYTSLRNVTKPNSRTVPTGDSRWTDYINKYNEKVKELASKYKNKVDAWEVWNEPDLYVNSGYDPYVHPSEFARLLRNAAASIRAGGASGTIILGGLGAGQPQYLADVVKYNGGHLNEIDAIGLHPYGRRPDGFPANWGFGHIDTFINDYYSIVAKPIWITEVGTDDSNMQSAYITNFYKNIISKHLNKVPVVIWFCYSDAMVSPYGLLSASGAKKASYYAYKNVLSTNNQLIAAYIVNPPENTILSGSNMTFKLSPATGSPINYRLTIKDQNNNQIFTKLNYATETEFIVNGLPTNGSRITAILETTYVGSSLTVTQHFTSVTTNTPTPPPTPSPTGPIIGLITETEWFMQVYENQTLSGNPTVSKELIPPYSTDTTFKSGLDFNWDWRGTPDASRLPFKVDEYSIRFIRTKDFDAGTYKFKLNVNDGAKVYVDDILVFDKWNNTDFNTVFDSSPIILTKGLHKLTVEYVEKYQTANIRFGWVPYTSPTPVITPTRAPTPIITATPIVTPTPIITVIPTVFITPAPTPVTTPPIDQSIMDYESSSRGITLGDLPICLVNEKCYKIKSVEFVKGKGAGWKNPFFRYGDKKLYVDVVDASGKRLQGQKVNGAMVVGSRTIYGAIPIEKTDFIPFWEPGGNIEMNGIVTINNVSNKKSQSVFNIERKAADGYNSSYFVTFVEYSGTVVNPTPIITPNPTSIPTGSSIVIFNGYGISSKDRKPVINLVVERNGVKSIVDTEAIGSNGDHQFSVPYKLLKNDTVYFYFCNDTTDNGDCSNRAGSANRDLVFNYSVIDNVKIELKKNLLMPNGSYGPLANIKYDRANREDGSLYNSGTLRDVSSNDGNFGTYFDNKAVFWGDEFYSWGVQFKGYMPFNGAISIGINWDN